MSTALSVDPNAIVRVIRKVEQSNHNSSERLRLQVGITEAIQTERRPRYLFLPAFLAMFKSVRRKSIIISKLIDTEK